MENKNRLEIALDKDVVNNLGEVDLKWESAKEYFESGPKSISDFDLEFIKRMVSDFIERYDVYRFELTYNKEFDEKPIHCIIHDPNKGFNYNNAADYYKIKRED